MNVISILDTSVAEIEAIAFVNSRSFSRKTRKFGRPTYRQEGRHTTDSRGRKGALRPLDIIRESLKRRFRAMFYGAMVWDPLLILAQIGCLQGLNYITLGLLLWTFVGTQVNDFTLKYFFDYKVLSLGSFVGICSILAHLLNSLVG